MIKAINREDIPECVRVIRTSFKTVADEFGFTVENAPMFVAYATNEEKLYGQMDNEHRPMYAFYEQDKIIGYYSLQMQENRECELNNISVLPEYRHHQIGGKLLEHAFKTAKELGCVKMNVGIVEENQKLRKWYEKWGFIHIGTKKYDWFPFTCGYLEKNL